LRSASGPTTLTEGHHDPSALVLEGYSLEVSARHAEHEPWGTQSGRTSAWLAYVLPLAVFLAVGSLEPTRDRPGGALLGLAIPYATYPWIYGLKILATLLAIGWAWPEYRPHWRPIRPLAIVVGFVGAAVWIALAELRPEARLLQILGLDGWVSLAARSGFNPLAELAAQPVLAWSVLALRLFGLVAVIALAEEFFLRGFVMRLVVDEHWQHVPIGTITIASALVGTLLPMAMHPGELSAAAAWFSLITWLMVRTRSLWDCVVAHAMTNLGLGLYVILTGHWGLM
jgi:CAAX prenyl protease-like protein